MGKTIKRIVRLFVSKKEKDNILDKRLMEHDLEHKLLRRAKKLI